MRTICKWSAQSVHECLPLERRVSQPLLQCPRLSAATAVRSFKVDIRLNVTTASGMGEFYCCSCTCTDLPWAITRSTCRTLSCRPSWQLVSRIDASMLDGWQYLFMTETAPLSRPEAWVGGGMWRAPTKRRDQGTLPQPRTGRSLRNEDGL
jgi:hypothetical protein